MPKQEEARAQQLGAEKRAILRAHVLFGKLSSQHIDRLSSCIVTKSVKRGTNIFSKGDSGSSLFAINKGTVKISVPSVGGRDAVFNLLHEGEIFGEIALLDGRPRTADAIANTDCKLFVVERRDFSHLVREEPQIALKLIELLCLRLRHLSEQAADLMFLDLQRRLARALLRLTDTDPNATRMRERTAIITQADLAEMIGMSREVTNHQLGIWKKNKWVRLGRGAIVILSVDALSVIAETDSER